MSVVKHKQDYFDPPSDIIGIDGVLQGRFLTLGHSRKGEDSCTQNGIQLRLRLGETNNDALKVESSP